MDLPKWCSCGNKIGLFGVMPNTMNLSIMLYLMLHDNFIGHTIVILANGFGGLEDLILQLLSDELLIWEVDLGHDKCVLLLARSMRSIEDMAESVLIVAITASF